MNAEIQRVGGARVRQLWFQVHKWLGLLLAILVIPVSLTGSALVWHDWLDETLNPARYAVASPEPLLSPAAYVAAASAALAPGERISQIRYPEGGGPLVVTAARAPDPAAKPGARPVRTSLWLDPADGRVLDRAATNEGAVRVLHVLHGSLMVPGVGRQIVGWVGVAMLISSLTGLWLWWPLKGRWTRGLRWRRQSTTNANLHHHAGFWIVIPLAMLSFTGAWISFPAFFGPLVGEGGGNRPRSAPAQPLEAPAMTAGAAVAAAQAHATGPLVSIGWPTDQAPEWKVAFEREGRPAEVEVADATGAVKPPEPPKPETVARTMRRWHDGTGMGPVWQAVIFIGGIIPALLAVTGIIMWLRTRGWRGEVARRRRGRREAVAAE
jgi:uncharacterized iron-regulated membrane protein